MHSMGSTHPLEEINVNPSGETMTQELTEKPTSGSQSWLWASSPHLQQTLQGFLLDIFPLAGTLWAAQGYVLPALTITLPLTLGSKV